ncbi:type II toxin-antitoxin system Phd/YefM family antitoxin [Endothiovibrio diazotrophicus]
MTQTVNLYEAKTHLSHLVEQAAQGEEIIIAKAGKPKARLVPINEPGTPREAGPWAGQVWIADDFDAPLPEDLLESFEGSFD